MSIVLIAASAALGPMTEQGEFHGAIAFADTDALRALQAIARQPPSVVVLESTFAGTSRGTALINRIKADPALRECEIRVVSHRPQPSAVAPVVTTPEAGIAAEPVPPEPPAAAVALDHHGTRWAPRYDIVDGVELLVDGTTAALIDLSISGAQLASPTSLRPNQRVRLTLPDGLQPIRMNGEIVWAVFEMPRTGPRYRAGVAFADPDVARIQRFIETNKK